MTIKCPKCDKDTGLSEEEMQRLRAAVEPNGVPAQLYSCECGHIERYARMVFHPNQP